MGVSQATFRAEIEALSSCRRRDPYHASELNSAFGEMKRLYLKDPEIVQKRASVLASPRCSWNPSD